MIFHKSSEYPNTDTKLFFQPYFPNNLTVLQYVHGNELLTSLKKRALQAIEQ